MAVTDSQDNTLNEFSVREEENLQMLASTEHGATAKRKRKRKKRNEESNEQSQVEVNPKPSVDSLFSQEGNVEADADNPQPTPKKKKKKIKNVRGEQQLQTSDPSIAVPVESDYTKGEGARLGDANGNGDLCPKSLLDTPVPNVSHEENAEGTALNPGATAKKKRKKKILQGEEQTCDPSIRIGVEPDVTKVDGSREGDVNENGGLCPKTLLDTPIPIVSHEENAEGSAQNPSPTPKKKRKKKTLQCAEQICDPSIPIGVGPDVAKDEGSREGDVNENGGLMPKPLLDTPVPIVSYEENAEGIALNPSPTPKKKRKKNILQAEEQIRDPSIRIGVNPDVTKDDGSREGDVNANGGLCPKPLLDTPIPIVSHEENAEGSAQNPSPAPKKKRKKKTLQGAEQICDPSIPIDVGPDVAKDEGSREGDVNENGGLCPKPLLDTPVPIVSHAENAEGTALNPSTNPKKKRKKKKILQGEEQICDPSIRIGVERDVVKDEGSPEGDVNENGVVCPKSLLDIPIPIVSNKENAEGTALNPSPTPNKKRKEKILQGAEQLCDISIGIGVERDVAKDEGSQEGDVNENGGLCPKPLLDTAIPIISLEENAEATAQNPSPTPKKKSLQGAEQICDPSIRLGVEPDVTNEEGSQRGDAIGNGGLCPKTLLDAPLPIVSREENAQAIAQKPSPNPKKKKENLQGAEQICDPSIWIGVISDVPKEAGQQGSERVETCTQNPNSTPKRRRRKNVQGEQQLQICDPSISIGVEPDVKKPGAQQVNANEVGVSGISEERPLPDSTAPEDRHQKKDSARKKKKALKPQGAEAESEPELKESNKTENPQQCTLDPKLESKTKKEAGANAENSGVCSKPEVAPELYIAATTELEPKEKAELIKVNKEHPQPSSKPELESPIDMPTQMKPRKENRTREEKKKETEPSEAHLQHPQPQPCSNHAPTVRGIIEECPAPEGAESNEADDKPPETPVQGFLYPVVALSIGPTIPVQAPPKDTAPAIDQDQKMSEKKRKSNPIAAPSIEPTIPTRQVLLVDPATPVDPERMPKKKKKKSNSVRKKQRLESEKHKAHPTAETPVQKTEGPTTKKSMSCWACQQTGHSLEQCKRLKSLSKDEEVCFFCGEIGHSLGKCGVSQAGGRFARCLLCYKHGHFGYNCPQSDNEKKHKVLVANGAFNGSEINAKCSLCHERGHYCLNCPKNGHDPKVLAANGGHQQKS